MENQMQLWIRPEDWLGVVRREYLQDFVRRGGAAVKVVVPMDDNDREDAIAALRSLAESENYIFAAVDSSITKIHLFDKVFHAIAMQIPWKDMARCFVRSCLEKELKLPNKGIDLRLSELAKLNDRDEARLGQDINKILERNLIRDFHMCQEYRFAMVALCLEVIGQEYLPEGVIEEWLKGELRLISALKRALIFQKVARHNARHMLLSLTHWLRLAGKNGLVIALDISRYMVPKRPKETDGCLYYSRPATLDAYEVLRQLIDGTDDMEGCFVTVLPTLEFLNDEQRGMKAYQALRIRVDDESHDRCYPNPLSSLIRLSNKAKSLNIHTEGKNP